MQTRTIPDALDKLTHMGDVTLFEPAGDRPQAERPIREPKRYQSRSLDECITHLTTPRGKKPVLKTMVTTACEKDCYYCPFRAGRAKTDRVTFRPDDLAGAFDRLQHKGAVDGLFLSSGIIKGGVTTQDKMLDTVEIIRKRYAYSGYVHLKIMPGSEYDQIARAMQLADRISLNLEAPTQARVQALAPKKDFDGDLLERIQWANQIRQTLPPGQRPSIVTQFVVGAVGDTDLELLSLSQRLYRQARLQRAYYSAFHPIADTPFEHLPAVAPLREHRLYQASFLLRDYAWDVEEMSFADDGNLRLDVDPKQAWADVHLQHNPLDVMKASREELLRIPGIGPRGAAAILRARKQGTLTDLAQLRAIGIRAPQRVVPYILLDGHRPPQQLPLF
ncbi:MAG: radical SAM protein [Chloroflexi bacterium]|nr:radical SAM protein [Chloroflexota bacterium]